MAQDSFDDRFETVAITWSQPEAAVLLSMFAFYGIPAFALGRSHASVDPILIVALQGLQIRVHDSAVAEAQDLLANVALRPAAVRAFRGRPWIGRLTTVLLFVAGYVPMTRTASTFFLTHPRKT